ncbi:MAG: hypothetical protein PUH99_06715 [Firmicutes bacterium]|nr:hypothetical protein [Bacillota bacterium]MDY5531679.1 hypothetical protein [Pumilibacteraceae bacterium]
MINVIALLIGLMTAVNMQPVKKPITVAVTDGDNGARIVRVNPRADEDARPVRLHDERRTFDMTDYDSKKQALDEKYSRRAYLREKMSREMADFLADYEEYRLLSANYRREYRALGEPNANGAEKGGSSADNDNAGTENKGTYPYKTDADRQNGRENGGTNNGGTNNGGMNNGRTNNGSGSYNGNNSGGENSDGNGTNNGREEGGDKIFKPVPPSTDMPRPLLPGDNGNDSGDDGIAPLPMPGTDGSFVIGD